jgi:phosphoenolpyruvate-protein kinase (PTS system EI component)
MIPEIKKIVRSVKVSECEQLAKMALETDTAERVLEFLVKRTRSLLPEYLKTYS